MKSFLSSIYRNIISILSFTYEDSILSPYTIDSFNDLKLEEQQSVIYDRIKVLQKNKDQNQSLIKVLQNIDDLLKFIQECHPDQKENYFFISNNNDIDEL